MSQEEDAELRAGAAGTSLAATTSSLDSSKRLSSQVWPDSSQKVLEVELAQIILRSELLVTEDEEFINNYILTEQTLEEYKTEQEGGGQGSVMRDVLLLSGSLAAVAGAVFFFSERTRSAVAAASVLPTALAAASSVRIGTKVRRNEETEEFKKMIKQMLGDMKHFKMILRKSLNLIQGMEMMNQGYINNIASNYDGRCSNGTDNGAASEDKLSKTLCQRSSFMSLRRAIYTQAVQMISVYRQAIEKLMTLCPLAEHIDLRDHYLAFIDLDKFGIEKDVPDERLSVKQLKDTIQLSLLQQSEYLRRFSLTFCQKVQEEEELNKTGILKHVKEIISKLRIVSDRMSRVLEYHQALGLVPLHELDQKCLALKKQQSLDQKLLPLRNVYSTLFSTGLHLQNSLIKLRHIEGLFERLEASKDKETVSSFIPSDKQVIEWLQGFQDIQSELNHCLTCLDDGVEEMETLGRPRPSSSSSSSATAKSGDDSDQSPTRNCKKNLQPRVQTVEENEEMVKMEKVFEAFITCDFKVDKLCFEDDFVTNTAGCSTDSQWERDERELESGNNLSLPASLISTNVLDLSQETDSDAESILSDTKTILSPEERAQLGDTQSVCSLSSRASERENSDSNHSDVEVERAHRIYNRALMSRSICEDARGLQSKTKIVNKKMLEMRSFSSPNFKNLEAVESASPYFSLEMLDCDNTDSEADSQDDSSDSSISIKNPGFPSKEKDSSSSTDTSSGVQMFRKPKIIKRPSNRQMSNRLKSCLIREETTASSQNNHFYNKHRETVLASIQPQGFDRKLAVDAIAKSRQMRANSRKGNQTEEYFGSSDSD